MEKQYINFLSRLAEPVILVKSKKIIWVNESFSNLFKIEHHCSKLNHLFSNKAIVDQLESEETNFHSVIFSETHVIPEKQGPLEINWLVFPIFAGNAAHPVYCCVGDFSDQLSSKNEALALKAEIKNILDCTPGKLYWKDVHSHYVGANKEWLDLVQKPSIEDIADQPDEVFFGNEAELLRKNDRWVMKTQKTLVKEEAVQLPSGEKRYFLATKKPRYSSDGSVIGVIGNSIDVTELKQAKKKLKDSETREVYFKAMSTLSGMMAHELKTPLMSIVLNASSIKDFFPILVKSYRDYVKLKGTQDIREGYLADLETIANDLEMSASHAGNTIDMMLSGFRYSTSQLIPMETIEINTVIQQALNDYPLTEEERKCIKIFPTEKCHLLTMPNIITHVIHNLLKNALRAIKETHRGLITISVSETQKDEIEIRFQDTAMGIPKEILQHIFTPFYTTKDTKTNAGLGLYFCKMALEKINASITCKSKEGEYTLFIIRIKKVILKNEPFVS